MTRGSRGEFQMMPMPNVTYFDFAGSRGEEVRLALVIAGVAFDDNPLLLLNPHRPSVMLVLIGSFGHNLCNCEAGRN